MRRVNNFPKAAEMIYILFTYKQTHKDNALNLFLTAEYFIAKAIEVSDYI